MTYLQVKDIIGKKGYIEARGLSVKVEILDFKVSYGKERFLVKPVYGRGSTWVERVSGFVEK